MAEVSRISEEFFRPSEFALFKRTARLFKVYIAVRRINKKSLEYIGAKGYQPKLIDCKAKSAKNDVTVEGKRYSTAGLVVDCDLLKAHLPEIFGAGKIKKAQEAWTDFVGSGRIAPLSFYGADGKAPISYNHGFSYFTELDKNNKHYGCIRHSPSGQTRGGKYVHADYDLYAVVPADDPSANVFVREERLGQPHSRSPQQMDVQNYITAQVAGLVNHGEQDTFKRDLDDELDVFYPDGETVKAVLGEGEIATLYEDVFSGRKMRSAKGDPRNNVVSQWDSI
ncbi:hypothetical protein [Terrarubrum flagellatum]|uniref:hypothetical protein n=1 Tax=Terrirubrum flagellatum TaxID=2895980 RepID=UPI00314567C7